VSGGDGLVLEKRIPPLKLVHGTVVGQHSQLVDRIHPLVAANEDGGSLLPTRLHRHGFLVCCITEF
jgi:hypothetical protein